jgi:membrane protease YdiL (CAAX protease family)
MTDTVAIFAQQQPTLDRTAVEAARATPLEGVVFLLAIGAGLAVWAWLLRRRRRGIPLLAYEPRRVVPWGTGHALVVLVGHRLALELAPLVIVGLLGIPARVADAGARTVTDHPVSQLLRERPGFLALLLCVVSVVLVAPIVEEFVFRVVFQGGLEADERRARRQRIGLPGWPRGLLPIVAVSLVFAALHYRSASPALSSRFLLAAVIGSAVANLVVLFLAILLLRRTTGATWEDLGFNAHRLARDVRTGLIAFVAAAPLVYAAQTAALLLLPRRIAPDPVGLFVFAVALGFLYFRTHRAAPSIVVHMALNGTTLVLLLLM